MPIGTPNCLRSFRYCTVRSNASVGAAEHFGGEAGAGAVQHRLEHIGAAIDPAEHGFGADRHVRRSVIARRVAAVDHDGAASG